MESGCGGGGGGQVFAGCRAALHRSARALRSRRIKLWPDVYRKVGLQAAKLKVRFRSAPSRDLVQWSVRRPVE